MHALVTDHEVVIRKLSEFMIPYFVTGGLDWRLIISLPKLIDF